MAKILGLCGSLRAGSSNEKILLAARGLGVAEIEIFASLGKIPHFNPDLDREGMAPPAPVAELRRAIDGCDAVLISTPEYAHGIPGVLKNALDWLVSHPGFIGKRVGVWMGSASSGDFAREALLEVLRTMSTKVVPDAVVTLAGSRVGYDEAALKRALEALTAGAG